MIDRAQQAADAIDSVAALTAHQARSVLNEYTKDDLIAAIATGHGGRLQLKHEIAGIDYTDIVEATGLANLYLLAEGETVVATWIVVTEVFDGTDSNLSAFSSCQAYPAGGSAASTMILSDSFITTETSASDPNGGMIYAGPGQASATTSNFPLAAGVPGGGALQLVVDFANGAGTNLPVDRGTQGHLDFHLIIAVAP